MTSYDYVIIAYAISGGSILGFSIFVFQTFRRVTKAASQLEEEK